jgi:biopolymer transport protein TolR
MFMVTAPLMQQGIDVDLPKTSSTGVEVTEDPFILVIEASGKISAANVSIPREQLGPKVKSIFVNRKNKQVYIQADRKTDYGIVAEVMADIKAAGISNIGLVTLPKD